MIIALDQIGLRVTLTHIPDSSPLDDLYLTKDKSTLFYFVECGSYEEAARNLLQVIPVLGEDSIVEVGLLPRRTILLAFPLASFRPDEIAAFRSDKKQRE